MKSRMDSFVHALIVQILYLKAIDITMACKETLYIVIDPWLGSARSMALTNKDRAKTGLPCLSGFHNLWLAPS